MVQTGFKESVIGSETARKQHLQMSFREALVDLRSCNLVAKFRGQLISFPKEAPDWLKEWGGAVKIKSVLSLVHLAEKESF